MHQASPSLSQAPSPAPLRLAPAQLWALVFIATALTSSLAGVDAILPDRQVSRELDAQICGNNEDCNVLSNSKCNLSSRQCICKGGFSPINRSACGKLLGDPCESSCDAHNSRCENICTCEDGLTASKDRSFCYGLPLIYGDACDHNDNCTYLGDNMQCKGYRCQCKEKYVRWDGACKEKIDKLNEKCDDFTQVCYSDLEGSEETKRKCVNGFCKCRHKFAAHNGICKEKISLLGVPCNDSLHVCYLESDGKEQKLFCKNGLCQCKDKFVLDEGKCKKKIGVLGSKCIPDNDTCYVDIEGYHPKRHCNNGICQCRKGYRSDGGMCKQKISLLGAHCNASSDVCYIEEDGEHQITQCTNGVCQCKTEFVLVNAKCQKATTCGTSQIVPAVLMCLLGLSIWYLE